MVIAARFSCQSNDEGFCPHLTTYLAVISVLCFWGEQFFWGVAFAIGAALQFLYVISVMDR